MPEPKTKPTSASVEEYIASRASDEQQADSKVLMKTIEIRVYHPSLV